MTPDLAALARELKFRDPARAADARARHRADRRADRRPPGLPDARLRQPRAGDRPVRPPRDPAARRGRHHGARAVPSASRTCRKWTRPSRSPSVACTSRPTATWSACPAPANRWPTCRPRAAGSTWSTASTRRSISRANDRRGRLLRDRVRDDRRRHGRRRARRACRRTSPSSPRTSTSRPRWRSSPPCPTRGSAGSSRPATRQSSPGWKMFEPLAERYRLPIVVAGFEPLDILAAILRLLELVAQRRGARREHVSALRDARREPRTRRDSSGRCSRSPGVSGGASRTCRAAISSCAPSSRTSMRGMRFGLRESPPEPDATARPRPASASAARS